MSTVEKSRVLEALRAKFFELDKALPVSGPARFRKPLGQHADDENIHHSDTCKPQCRQPRALTHGPEPAGTHCHQRQEHEDLEAEKDGANDLRVDRIPDHKSEEYCILHNKGSRKLSSANLTPKVKRLEDHITKALQVSHLPFHSSHNRGI